MLMLESHDLQSWEYVNFTPLFNFLPLDYLSVPYCQGSEGICYNEFNE